MATTTIAAWVAMVERRQTKVIQLASGEAGSRLVERTPVRTGKARQGWGAGKNGFNRNGGGRIVEVASSLQPGDAFTVTNTVSYIRPLDTGWSAQAPAGMVDPTVVEWRSIVSWAVERAR